MTEKKEFCCHSVSRKECPKKNTKERLYFFLQESKLPEEQTNVCTKNQRKERKGFITHSTSRQSSDKTAHDVVCKIQARKKERKQASKQHQQQRED
jgi:hypothetical protein